MNSRIVSVIAAFLLGAGIIGAIAADNSSGNVVQQYIDNANGNAPTNIFGVTTSADGITGATINAQNTASFNYGWDNVGTVWDRLRVTNGPTDALGNGAIIGLQTIAAPIYYNGASWDKARAVQNGLNNAATGIAAAGVVAQCDEVTPVTTTENSFADGTLNCQTHQLKAQTWSSFGSWNFAVAAGGISNTATAVTIKTAAGAGIKNVLNSCQFSSNTLGGTTEIAIRDGAAGTVIFRELLNTTALPLTTVVFEHPLIGSANTLMEVVTLTAVTGNVYVSCQGNITS